jgi:hypothetical protein
MFQDENKNKRKFTCFVCGRVFTEFEEFKNHIIEKHEEGRDYVICPLERCKTPVRDIKMHFKVKHPSEKIPEKGQSKALIWRDVKSNGEVKTRKPKFREGWYHSTKMNQSFFYRSGYEAKVFELLDSWNGVLAYTVEEFKIPYIFEGKQHEYIPDIFVAYTDGSKEVWEIKPATQTSLEKNKAKWHFAENACKERNWIFRVITEKEIEKLKKTVRDQYLQ